MGVEPTQAAKESRRMPTKNRDEILPVSPRSQSKATKRRMKAKIRARLTMTASAVRRSSISNVRRLGSRIKLSLTEFRITSIIQSRKQ
jgi:hypothetical protein